MLAFGVDFVRLGELGGCSERKSLLIVVLVSCLLLRSKWCISINSCLRVVFKYLLFVLGWSVGSTPFAWLGQCLAGLLPSLGPLAAAT